MAMIVVLGGNGAMRLRIKCATASLLFPFRLHKEPE
jgi:hypothetical protein